MRLIDADVFKTEYENLITWVSHRAEKARLREFIKDIQEQPTIKAIPVEWLYQKRSLYLEHECYMSLMVINEILNWWEKEHEKDI